MYQDNNNIYSNQWYLCILYIILWFILVNFVNNYNILSSISYLWIAPANNNNNKKKKIAVVTNM
jgi:hypothetical protein